MEAYTIPDQLIETHTNKPTIGFINYTSEGTAVRNKVLFTQNVISFLARGFKEIHQNEQPLAFDHGAFAIIRSGHCLMTEISSDANYRSLLFFFDDELLNQFKLNYAHLLTTTQEKPDAIVLPYDAYSLNFRNSLELLSKQDTLSNEIKESKLEEILLYLVHSFPEKVAALFSGAKSRAELEFKKIVENNKLANLKMEELAFLCNMSLSTFKRYFQKYYGTAPHKWMLSERMKFAGLLLKKDKQPNEIFSMMGYDSYSNFARAFKQFHAVSPKEYRSLNG